MTTAPFKDLLTQNGKMKLTSKASGKRFYDLGLPPLYTCPNAGVCATCNGCFALQGRYTFSPVKRAQWYRLECTMHEDFVPVFSNQIAVKERTAIRKETQAFIRFQSVGDIYSRSYLNKLIAIAQSRPETMFYAYTKMVSLIKSVKLPKNFTVIFSYGGTEDHSIKPTDKHAKVFKNANQLKLAGYTNCSKSDYKAWLPSTVKVGLIYHGTRKCPDKLF